jgi:hypothetical protein
MEEGAGEAGGAGGAGEAGEAGGAGEAGEAGGAGEAGEAGEAGGAGEGIEKNALFLVFLLTYLLPNLSGWIRRPNSSPLLLFSSSPPSPLLPLLLFSCSLVKSVSF